MVSVLIPAYNYAHTLRSAVDSVLTQDFTNLELIVLDDASTDDTAALMQSYRHDSRVRYIRQTQNMGCVRNMNSGFAHCRGLYLCSLSADDKMLPGFLSKTVQALHGARDIDVVYTRIWYMNNDEVLLRRSVALNVGSYRGGHDELVALISYGCNVFMPAVLAPRELYERLGYFAEGLLGFDTEMIARWAAAGIRFGYIAEPLIGFRIHGSQASGGDFFSSGKFLKEFLEIIAPYLEDKYASRLAGSEHGIRRFLQFHEQTALASGKHEATERLPAVYQRLTEITDQNNLIKSDPHVHVILFGEGEFADVEQSVLSLVEQYDSAWQATVIAPESWSAALVALDPLQRVRTVERCQPMGEADMLNATLRMCAGNAFSFLQFGDRWPASYVHSLRAKLATPDSDLILSLPLFDTSAKALPAQVPQAMTFEEAVTHLPAYPTFVSSCLTVKKRLFDRLLPFTSAHKTFAIWGYLLRMQSQVHFASLNEHVIIARRHARVTAAGSAESSCNATTLQTMYATYPAASVQVEDLRRELLAR